MPSGRYHPRNASSDDSDSRLIEYEIKAFDRVRFVKSVGREKKKNVRIEWENFLFVLKTVEMRQGVSRYLEGDAN